MTIEATLTNEEKRVLKALAEHGEVTPQALLDATGLGELVEVMNAASWLQAKELVRTSEEMRHRYELTDEGRRCVEEGLPERVALELLTEAGGALPMSELTGTDRLDPSLRGVMIGQLKARRQPKATGPRSRSSHSSPRASRTRRRSTPTGSRTSSSDPTCSSGATCRCAASVSRARATRSRRSTSPSWSRPTR